MSSQAFAENFGRCRTASRVRRSVSVPCAVTLATSLDVSPRTPASTARNSFLSFELAPLCERHHSVPSITVSHRQPYQVLRRRRWVPKRPRASTRTSGGLPSGRSLAMAVRADALIHGPCLVARLVGSEWRTRRPLHRVHPINYKGDQA